MTLSRLVRPSETISILDGYLGVNVARPGHGGIRPALFRHHKVNFPTGSPPPERHPSSGGIAGFADGHAKFIRRVDVISVVNDNGFWRWRYRSADR